MATTNLVKAEDTRVTYIVIIALVVFNLIGIFAIVIQAFMW